MAAPVTLVDANGHANSDTFPQFVSGRVHRASANFTRPADTTAYAAGDLIANSTTAGSVVPMSFNVGCSEGLVRAAYFKSNTTTLPSTTAMRLHLWSQAPTTSGGDNAAVFASTAGLATSTGYLGYIDMSADVWFSDATMGSGVPYPDVHFDLGTGTTLYGLLEATSAITPASEAVITASLGILPA